MIVLFTSAKMQLNHTLRFFFIQLALLMNYRNAPYYNHLGLRFQENCVLNCIYGNAIKWTQGIYVIRCAVIQALVFPFKELRASGRYIFIKAAPFWSQIHSAFTADVFQIMNRSRDCRLTVF